MGQGQNSTSFSSQLWDPGLLSGCNFFHLQWGSWDIDVYDSWKQASHRVTIVLNGGWAAREPGWIKKGGEGAAFSKKGWKRRTVGEEREAKGPSSKDNIHVSWRRGRVVHLESSISARGWGCPSKKGPVLGVISEALGRKLHSRVVGGGGGGWEDVPVGFALHTRGPEFRSTLI